MIAIIYVYTIETINNWSFVERVLVKSGIDSSSSNSSSPSHVSPTYPEDLLVSNTSTTWPSVAII